MNINALTLETLDLDCGANIIGGSFIVPNNEELVDIINDIRKQQGNSDLVSIDANNDVYYDTYVFFNTAEGSQQVELQTCCKYGEKDDEVWYNIPLSPHEEKILLYKIINCLIKEIE